MFAWSIATVCLGGTLESKLSAIAKAGGIVNAANAIALAKSITSNPATKSNKKKRTNN